MIFTNKYFIGVFELDKFVNFSTKNLKILENIKDNSN